MAGCCSICRKKYGFIESGNEIIAGFSLCSDCFSIWRELDYTASIDRYQYIKNHMNCMLNNSDIPPSAKNLFLQKCEKWDARYKASAPQREEKARLQINLDSMMITTGNNFEGYSIIKYIDVICEEIIFSYGLVSALRVSFSDGKVFSDSEMSKSVEGITRVRQQVKEKFMRHAAEIGANAVIGVTFESAVGQEIQRVAIFGTAVIIEKSKSKIPIWSV